MALLTKTSASLSVHGRLRLARLLSLSEGEFEGQIRELEANDLFRRLLKLGVLSVEPYPRARFGERRFKGWEMRASAGGIGELLDGNGSLARLIERVGQKRFEAYFLGEEPLSNERRAELCSISPEEARRLRELVDRIYIRGECDSAPAQSAPTEVFSSVAGVELDGGRPVLAFFHRETWKGRYRINKDKCEAFLAALPGPAARRVERLFGRIEFLDRRKSTLYRVLEALVQDQADFLITRDPDRRRPLTQRAIAMRLGIAPSVLNGLIGNKSVQLPWGLEAPLKILMPSSKTILRDRLFDLASEHPELTDEGLRDEMGHICGTRRSRRSIAQYRRELGLGGRKRRSAERIGFSGSPSTSGAPAKQRVPSSRPRAVACAAVPIAGPPPPRRAYARLPEGHD